jgi:gliding motility-associated protein GldM
MAGGKVTVRQKMINMMYLVLTALLALNVSKDILHAFHLVEVSMNESGVNIDQKNAYILSAFKADYAKRPEKVKPFYDKAKKADKITKEFIAYVDKLKEEIEKGAGGRKEDGNPKAELNKNDDIENHANLLIVQGKGAELKAKINKTRKDLLALLDKQDQKKIKSDLIAEDDPKKAPQTWESELFEHSPAAAVVTLFAKIKNDAKNTEAQVLETLSKAIDKSSQTFDKVVAKIIPKSGFVMSGGKFEADIMLVAYDSKQQNDVIINGNTIKPEGGVAKYEAPAAGEGTQKVSGYIDFQGKDGNQKLAFETEYTVFKGAATISADAMNVMYIGLENPVSISVPGFPPSSVIATMSNGSLSKKSSTSYIAKVSKRGEAIIRVSVKMDDGTTKSMGQAKFRVRNIPKPIAQLGTLQNGEIQSVGTIRANANRIYGSLGEGFAFEGIRYTVIDYVFLFVPRRGEPRTIRGRGQNLDGGMKSLIQRMRSGDRILLDQIRAKGPDGTRNLAPVIITAR